MCGDCGGKGLEGERNQLNKCCQPRKAFEANPCINEYKETQQENQDRNTCIGDYERHLYESHEGDICERETREPYQIPGYAGHVPTLQSHSGGTYGHDTHEALVSSQKSKWQKPSSNDKSHVCPKPLHEPYRIPGYTGHVQGLQNMVGGTYGHDTHKLMYSVQSYPNRQESISPYKPKTSFNFGNQNGECPVQEDFDHQSFSGTYQRPDEHFYKPQFKYRIGDTFATRAELTLVDPCVNKESKVIISTRELDDTQVVRVPDTLEKRVQELPYINQPIRHQPMVPGFDSYIDAMRGARGQRYEFTDQSTSEKKLQQQLVLEKGSVRKPWETKNSGPTFPNQIQSGNGEVPFGYGKYDNSKQKYTNSAIYDFASNYRRRQSTEWAPATISRPDPPAFDIPGEIYNQHSGLLPGYSAHIPGAMFRCGKSFTDDSRDARKALRGDRF